ncbi:MAG: hypothetical protein M3R36_12040 [Bacteroidota bacterium]|nr:hypothetical protein [Bacteroidota bacterium]
MSNLTPKNIKENLPLILSISLLLIIVSIIYFISKNLTGGKFVYALDDAYIHLAHAKNIVANNVWGITKYEYSSASSSPAWTIILTMLFLIFGVNQYIPFILNIFFSVLLLFVVFKFLKEYDVSNFFAGLTLITIIIFLPLSIHVYSGMEHILHSVMTILFIRYSAEALGKNLKTDKIFWQSEKYLLLISFFITTIRYEGFFLDIVVSVLFLIRRKYLLSMLIMVAGLILPSLYGILSIQNGGSFFPNSIMLKSIDTASLNFFDSGSSLYNHLAESKKIIFLFLMSVILFILQIKFKKSFWSAIPLLLFILISTILIHKTAINNGYFRYDAYLVVTAMTVNSLALYDYCSKKFKLKLNFELIKKNKIAMCIFLIFIVYSVYREFSLHKTITAIKNIYEQQFQMAEFITKFYYGKGVALNDIGTVNFFTDIQCVDIIGLGSNQIAKKKLDSVFDSDCLNKITKEKNVRIAVIYDKWFQKDLKIPEQWINVGQWKISDNYICGDDEVTFYAVDPQEEEALSRYLKSFSEELPVTVMQSGTYLLKE